MSGAGLAVRILLPSYSRRASTANRHHQWDVVSVCEHTRQTPGSERGRAGSFRGYRYGAKVVLDILGTQLLQARLAIDAITPLLHLWRVYNCCAIEARWADERMDHNVVVGNLREGGEGYCGGVINSLCMFMCMCVTYNVAHLSFEQLCCIGNARWEWLLAAMRIILLRHHRAQTTTTSLISRRATIAVQACCAEQNRAHTLNRLKKYPIMSLSLVVVCMPGATRTPYTLLLPHNTTASATTAVATPSKGEGCKEEDRAMG